MTLQLAGEANADLLDARIAGAGGGVDLLAQRDLVGERNEASGSSAPYIAWLVRGGGGGGAAWPDRAASGSPRRGRSRRR